MASQVLGAADATASQRMVIKQGSDLERGPAFLFGIKFANHYLEVMSTYDISIYIAAKEV